MAEHNDSDAVPGDLDAEVLRKFHDALDSAEAHLKQIVRSERDGLNPIDLLVTLRQRVNAQFTQNSRLPQ